MRRSCGDDDAAADLIGTILTLGVTVTLVASVGLMLLQTRTAEVDPPDVSGLPAAIVGATNLTVLHTSGDAAHADRLRGIVLVNGSVWYDGPPILNGPSWRLGERLELGPFPQPLPPGALVEMSLVDTGAGVTLLAETLRLGGSAATVASGWGAPTVEVRFANGLSSTSASLGASLQVEARVTYAGGRARVTEVVADARALGGGSRVELRDDGLGGDAVADDGTYTATLRVPEQFPTGTYAIPVTAFVRGGASGSSTGTVSVEHSSGFYNTAVMLAAGHRILSYDSASGAHDSVSAQVKLRFNETAVDSEGLFKDADGKKWNLTAVNVWYDPLKPGGSGSATDCTSSAPCIPLNVVCFTSHVRAFRADNATISHFQRERDTFRYFLELIWTEKSNVNNKFRETIEASETAVWFFLRANTDFKVVRHDGWPSEFTNCTG